jgi:hypothetical protein
MPDDHEELPSLEEVRLKLRDLHFSEYHRDHPARQQLYEQNIAGVIQRGREMWERVRSEPKAVELADDWAKGELPARSGHVVRTLPPARAARLEGQQSPPDWAIERFEECSRTDDLRRIQKIGLTIEQWVRILEREKSVQADKEGTK